MISELTRTRLDDIRTRVNVVTRRIKIITKDKRQSKELIWNLRTSVPTQNY